MVWTVTVYYKILFSPNQTESTEWFGGWTIPPIVYDHVKHQVRGELSYLAPLGSEKTEITNILFYILNYASVIKFEMWLFFNILPQQETKIKDYGTLPSIKIPIYIHWISLCKWMEGGGCN